MNNFVSDHKCYILKSLSTGKIYIGYTINFERRIRQHNGEIKGGAKRTSGEKDWVPICIIRGFYEKSSALRFEYKLQHNQYMKKVDNITKIIKYVIENGDNNYIPWVPLNILWYDETKAISCKNLTNEYFIDSW